MRIAQGTLIAAVATLALASTAHGWTHTVDGQLAAGPQLAGIGTAWADGPQGGAMTVRRAPLDGPATALYSIPRAASCDRFEDLAASADLVAVLVFRGDADGSCMNAGLEVHVNAPAGGGKVLESTAGGFSQCAASGMDVDGGIVAVARYNCQQEPVRLHDVAAGTTSSLGLQFTDFENPLDVRIAGRYAAVLAQEAPGSAQHFFLVVWDRELGKEHYRVDVTPLLEGDDYVTATHKLALQPDGTVLVGIPTFNQGPRMRYGWASAAEPTIHAIPGSFATLVMPRVAIAGGLLAAARESPGSGAVTSFAGTVENVFSPAPQGWSIDFDGARLAWADFTAVHNEAYPHTPPPPAPAPTPVPKPAPTATPAPASTPAARVTALRGSQKAKALKAFGGTASDADGDLAMVRAGLVRVAGKRCQTLQKSGRLKASKPVAGKCVPATFLTATGTSTWKLMLRKRLPAGRYVLYAQAVDAAGHAQLAFTKAAGNLWAFTLR